MLHLGSIAYAQNIEVEISDAENVAELVFTLPPQSKANTFSLDNPPRLVVDIPNQGTPPQLNLPEVLPGSMIRAWRSGQFDKLTGRLVFEFHYPISMSSQQQGQTLRVRIAASGNRLPDSAEKFVEKPSPPPRPKKKVVVLDAGHGGQDPGTTGRHGTKEKNLVLTFTMELKKILEGTGKYDVVLTRDSDFYIPLRERLAFARKRNADIFLSLHADSGASKARGLSVYTLSETASDKEAEALAVKENRSDIIAGVDLGEHDKDVANILISLAQRETNNQSAILADTLVSSLQNQDIPLLTRPHRFAGFAVLKAPDVPSVLVEIGFLSNGEEEKLLNKPAYRSKLANGLARAITHYFENTSKALAP